MNWHLEFIFGFIAGAFSLFCLFLYLVHKDD